MTPDPGELAAEDARFAKNTAVMSVGTALSRLTGFLRLSAAAWALGFTATALADTYNRANITPNILYELALGGILSSVFVPVFVEWLQERGREQAFDVADRVMTVALVVLGTIAALAAIAAPWLIRLYLAGSTATGADRDAQVALGAYFLRWFAPQIVFYGIGAVAIGVLQANRRFAAPMFAPILNNLAVIATFIVYGSIADRSSVTPVTITGTEKLILGAGTTLGIAAMTLALWPSLRRIGFRWHLRFDVRHEAVRRLMRLAAWVVVYVAANQIAYIVVIVLSRHTGDYSAYSAAFILFQLPHAIFAVSVFTALLPAMSGRWAAGDVDDVRALLSRGLRVTAFIVVPAAAGYVALAGPIVSLLLQHGETHAVDAQLIASTLRFFAIGLLFFSSFQLLSRTFYAMQDSRTPALVNVAAAALNIVVDVVYVLGFHMGVRGLALGHATTYLFSTAVCLVILHRRLGGLDESRIARSLARILLVSVLTGISAWAAARAVAGAGRAVEVAAGVAAGLLVFGTSTFIVRMEEADTFKEALVRRIRG